MPRRSQRLWDIQFLVAQMGEPIAQVELSPPAGKPRWVAIEWEPPESWEVRQVFVDVTHITGKKIVCLPTPGPNGTVEYVPEGWGITHFG